MGRGPRDHGLAPGEPPRPTRDHTACLSEQLNRLVGYQAGLIDNIRWGPDQLQAEVVYDQGHMQPVVLRAQQVADLGHDDK